MRYVPKIRVVFRLPTGSVVGQVYPPSLLLREAVHRAWPGMTDDCRVLKQDESLPLDRSLGELGLVNDSELEVTT